ncbi:hypothetical protein [Moraxella nonliquefaciens]|uniref:Uncharacterized protein n=1 Tax=Moraxella nonliquefaciens TaxID=478 RepID=A0A1B8QHA7_MORNO|nr:hypothetical protein [Moraxella nonliquefaciens]OBX82772.1 hypothetical protein A7456_06905 [Moraxella nonliquefaciens]QPT44906.1 hypothetical protein I6G26_02385 [Moraxella nonliquefaciens]QQC29937.1 hypothetical protein I6H63_01165 [Moraxella nonliquefaciens]
MRTEALFFKTLFFVFLSFYIASYIIFLMFAMFAEYTGYRTTDNFIESGKIVVFLPFLLGLVAIIFFSPVLLLVSFIQWGIRNKWLKNLISFLLIIIYGFLIFKAPSFRFYNTNLPDIIDETLSYLSISIPSTLLFMALLSYLTQYKKNRT